MSCPLSSWIGLRQAVNLFQRLTLVLRLLVEIWASQVLLHPHELTAAMRQLTFGTVGHWAVVALVVARVAIAAFDLFLAAMWEPDVSAYVITESAVREAEIVKSQQKKE